jgi:hypothetical protein
LQVSQAFLDNGWPPDFQRWFSHPSPLKKGFIGVFWNKQGTTCRPEAFDYLLHTYIRKDADQFWNAGSY